MPTASTPGGRWRGEEFAVTAALQFVRHLKAAHDYTGVHGVNSSLSIPHDVANYACGHTPVCEERERVVASGVVVVAAAGNQGYRRYVTAEDRVVDACNASSITDPDNAQVGDHRRRHPPLPAAHLQRGLADAEPLPIDLAMVSHIDDDHVAGLLQIVQKPSNLGIRLSSG